MATLDYTKRLENLQKRRNDNKLNELFLTKSFSAKDIPENVKYLYESVQPIDKKYNNKTIEAANKVQNHLEDGLQLHFDRTYRTQGSVRTDTNIKVYSDIDLLSIINKYYYPEISKGNIYKDSDPNLDIWQLRYDSTKILKGIYDVVDDSNEKCISVINKSLNRKIDVVFGFWYNSERYEEEKNEYYRGVYIYKMTNISRVADYPFAHISQVNSKGNSTNNGSKMGIRLLKTLRADSELEYEYLKSFQLTTIVHSIADQFITYSNANQLSIAKAISSELNKLISDPNYRKSIMSPNGTELPLSNDLIVSELKSLKQDLDILIEDSSKEILTSRTIQKAILTY